MRIRSKSLVRRFCIIGLCLGVTIATACGDDDGMTPDTGDPVDSAVVDTGTDTGSDVGTDAPIADTGADVAADVAVDVPMDTSFACEVDQWRDFSTTTCMDCPGSAIACEEFVVETIVFDAKAAMLTIELEAGVTEILAGTFVLNITLVGGETMSVSAAITPDGNTLVADLTGLLPADFESLDSISWDMNDACGTNHSSAGDIQSPDPGTFECGVI